MRLRKGLGLSAAAVALLSFASAAFAGGEARPAPANTITYSAQSVALATPANSVSIPSGAIVYQTTGNLAAADSVNIKPSVGTFVAPVPVAYTAGACTFNPGALQADGSVTYTVATPCARNTGQFELTLGSGTITGVSNLAVPGGSDIITAKATVAAVGQTDTTPTPVLTLSSVVTFVFSTRAAAPPLAIDLTGAGSTAGTQFTNAAGTGVTQNGFLGTFPLTERQD